MAIIIAYTLGVATAFLFGWLRCRCPVKHQPPRHSRIGRPDSRGPLGVD